MFSWILIGFLVQKTKGEGLLIDNENFINAVDHNWMDPGNQVAYVICYVELGKNENHDGRYSLQEEWQ